MLSFPLGQDGKYDINQETGAAMLGDIVISMERAMEQANIYGHSLQREVAFLTVHSMFHLLGYDHEAGGLEAVRMREKEEAALIQLGLPRTVSYSLGGLRSAKAALFVDSFLLRRPRASAPRCGRSAICGSTCAPRFTFIFFRCFTASRETEYYCSSRSWYAAFWRWSLSTPAWSARWSALRRTGT